MKAESILSKFIVQSWDYCLVAVGYVVFVILEV